MRSAFLQDNRILRTLRSGERGLPRDKGKNRIQQAEAKSTSCWSRMGHENGKGCDAEQKRVEFFSQSYLYQWSSKGV
jgi:hypothetical protein